MAWCRLPVLMNYMHFLKSNWATFLVAWLGLYVSQIDAQERAGKTIMAKGDVLANDQRSERKLVRRSPIYAIDLITTGQVSATQLRMKDGGLLSMQASSELAISDYVYNHNSHQGTVRMSLLKGGLRTVTGALQQTSDNYKLVTPVASIGVRGTHYEVELIKDDLFVGAWDGVIDIQVTVGQLRPQFSLGPTLDYRFAVVRADGSVEFLVSVPSAFSAGHSRDLYLAEPHVIDDGKTATSVAKNVAISEQENRFKLWQNLTDMDTRIDNDRLVSNWLPPLESSSSRSGAVTFDSVVQHSVTSSLGNISDFKMSMSVNFDNSHIPTGNLSFNDASGEWFAAFDGLISAESLDISVNFASHANNLADGTIEGLLIDQSQGVLGTISLHETASPDVSVTGAFELRESNP